MKTRKEAILLVAHKINDYILSQYYSLKKVAGEQIDVFLLLENGEGIKGQLPSDIQAYIFSVDTLNELNYEPIAETIIPGSNHFPGLQFYRDFPDYDYYWNIEYDVYFHGDWATFFSTCHSLEADFISSHIEYLHQRPYWDWWWTIDLKTLSISQTDYIKSFNPIYRISNNALKSLHRVLSEENSGHHEVLIPTVLKHLGFSLMDFGGLGSFTLLEMKNGYYSSQPLLNNSYTGCTMRFRPPFDRKVIENSAIDNKLYHPVKR